MTFVGEGIKLGILKKAGGIQVLGSLEADNVESRPSRTYYVDKSKTTSGAGSSWNNAFTTIQEAITASNATIDWSATPWLVDNYIYVAPGVYAENLTPAYSCHIIGMGVLGTDTATEIHPTSGSALAGTGLGLHLKNLWFECETAVPVIDFGICNNTLIENCVIARGIAGLATHGISTENATHLQVYNCSFESGVTPLTHGIYAAGGADKYFHNCRIIGNVIFAGIGLYIDANCTGSQAVIAHNIIDATTIGIDDDSDDCMIVGNWISAGTDCIDGNAKKMIDNHCNTNGAGAIELAST